MAAVGIIQFFKTVPAVNIFGEEKLCTIDKLDSSLDNSDLWRTNVKYDLRRGNQISPCVVVDYRDDLGLVFATQHAT